MIARVTADWHLRDWGSDYKNKLHTDHIIRCIEGCNTLVVAGDVFHRFGKVNATELAMFRRIQQKFPAYTQIISGNHDFYKHGHSVLWEIWENQPDAQMSTVTFVDWSPDWVKQVENLPRCNILFSHGPIKHSFLHSGFGLPEGADQHVISDRYKLSVFGDLHKMQCLMGNIWYAGSPLALDRSELGKKSGVLDVDLATRSVIPRLFDDPGLVTPLPKRQVQAVELKSRLSNASIHSNAKELFYLYAAQYELPDAIVEKFRSLQVEDDWQPPTFGGTLVPEYMTVRNFMPFKGEHTIKLGPGLHIVEGLNLDDSTVDNNNSGKTAVLSALYWCLTGRTLHGVSADEVVHQGESDCAVCVTFSDTRFIVRGRRDGKPFVKVNSHKTAGNSVDAQDTINKMLGLSLKQLDLCCTVSSSFGTATDSQRKEMLEFLLGDNRFKPYENIILDRLGKAEDAQKKSQARVLFLNATLATLQSRLTAHAEAHAKWVADQNKARNRQVDRIEKVSQELAATKEELRGHVTEKEALEFPEIADLEAREKQALEVLVKAEQLPTVSSVACPTCHRRYETAPSEEEVTANEEQVSKATEALDQARRALSSARAQRQYNRRVLDEIVSLSRKVATLSENLRDEQLALVEMEKGVSPYEEDVLRTTDEMVVVEAEHRVAASEESLLAQEAADLKELADIFGKKGLRLFLFEMLQASLNPLLQEYLTILSDGALLASMRMEEGKLHFDVSYKMGAATYNGNSTGTQKKMDLAVALAIAEVYQAPLRLLLADEYAGNLDDTAALKAFDLLGMDPTRCVLVTSHKEVKETVNATLVQVVREAGCSRIEGGRT